MKLLISIFISMVTTVVTVIGLMWHFDMDLPFFEGEVVPVVSEQVTNVIAREVIHHEEVQMDAIALVDQAVVGVIRMSDNEGFLGELTHSIGSGIVYAVEDGHTYLITNEHVIAGSHQIEVVFNDESRQRFTPTVLGVDVYTDLAVLRIDDFEAPVVATFGETEQLRIGQTVIAIGNPLGFQFAGSATVGVVSGHDRHVSIPITTSTGELRDWTMTVLQTDAAINPGNSGGPLINLAGEVVWINSMKAAESTAFGMSFSIPTHVALPVIDDLQRYGEVRRITLGISIFDLTTVPEVTRQQLELPEELRQGVFINEVNEDGQGAEMGLLPGDVITHVGPTPVNDVTTFRSRLFTYRAGDILQLSVIRYGEGIGLVIEIRDDHEEVE